MATTPQSAFSRLFFAAMMFRIALASLVMLLAVGGAAIARELDGEWSSFLGACAGVLVGVLIARAIKKRWDPLDRPAQEPVATGRDGSATHSLHEPG